jgi:hypothetical protein
LDAKKINMSAPGQEDYAVILNGDAVLLVDKALPAVASTVTHFWQTCEPVNRAIRKTYGIDATTVRCLSTAYTPEKITNFYLMEYQGGALPAGGTWTPLSKLPRLQAPATAKQIREWVTWFRGDHPQRRAWYRPGFFKNVVDELPGRLSSIRIRRIEQVRSWERSSIIRVLTDDSDDLYLKTISPMFAHEPALANWLYTQHPDQFPVVRDVRPGRDFIMAAYTGKSLTQTPELAIWQKALTDYATLQVEFAGRADELRALGVPERGLDWIKAHIDSLLDDDPVLRCGNYPLTDEQIARLRELRPRFHAACEALSTFNIPLSLEHGDLWTGQIIVCPEGGYLFTDWSDSAITCPLFSLPYFLAEVDNELPGVKDAREHLRAAYLTPWTAFEPMPRLLEAYESVKLLSPFYTTLQYAYDLIPRMEMRWEMENMVAYNLRLLLREAG